MIKSVYNIKRIIRTSFLGRSHIYLFVRFFVHRKEMDLAISRHLGQDVSAERKKQLKQQMKYAMVHYRWDFDEFFLFHFMDYDDAKRKSFVPEYDKNIFCDLVNTPKQADVFLDKWTTYKYFKDMFGRDVCYLYSSADIDRKACNAFLSKHQSFIVKPADGTRGQGIEIIRTQSAYEAKNLLLQKYEAAKGALFLEELIESHEKLKALHPESLNTLRIITIHYKDRVEVMHAWLRIGQGKSTIDNTSAGGVFGVIDVITGKIYGACDRLSHTFEKHPDSGINLIGFEIPYWEEAKALVMQAAEVLPEVRYVGWDVAIIPTGCVLVEGNDKGRWSFQFPKQEGARDEMNKILKEFNIAEIR